MLDAGRARRGARSPAHPLAARDALHVAALCGKLACVRVLLEFAAAEDDALGLVADGGGDGESGEDSHGADSASGDGVDLMDETDADEADGEGRAKRRARSSTSK